MAEFGCVAPEALHPFSEHILQMFINGEIVAVVFQRLFSLPNSEYIELATCLVKQFN